jgi:hypothetical protein
MVGVVGSSPIAPTKFGRRNKHLAETPGAFFLAVRKKYGEVGGEHVCSHATELMLGLHRSPSSGRRGGSALTCADSDIHLVGESLAALQQGLERLGVVQQQAIFDHVLVVLGQRLPSVSAGGQGECAGDRGARWRECRG